MSDVQSTTPLQTIEAPWGKQVEVQDIIYEGGFPSLRLRIREGKRFTMLDLDKATAERLGAAIAEWVANQDSA